MSRLRFLKTVAFCFLALNTANLFAQDFSASASDDSCVHVFGRTPQLRRLPPASKHGEIRASIAENLNLSFSTFIAPILRKKEQELRDDSPEGQSFYAVDPKSVEKILVKLSKTKLEKNFWSILIDYVDSVADLINKGELIVDEGDLELNYPRAEWLRENVVILERAIQLLSQRFKSNWVHKSNNESEIADLINKMEVLSTFQFELSKIVLQLEKNFTFEDIHFRDLIKVPLDEELDSRESMPMFKLSLNNEEWVENTNLPPFIRQCAEEGRCVVTSGSVMSALKLSQSSLAVMAPYLFLTPYDLMTLGGMDLEQYFSYKAKYLASQDSSVAFTGNLNVFILNEIGDGEIFVSQSIDRIVALAEIDFQKLFEDFSPQKTDARYLGENVRQTRIKVIKMAVVAEFKPSILDQSIFLLRDLRQMVEGDHEFKNTRNYPYVIQHDHENWVFVLNLSFKKQEFSTTLSFEKILKELSRLEEKLLRAKQVVENFRSELSD